jgi:transposase InsO family protein
LRRFFVAAVFDVFSRMPLAVQTSCSEPDGDEMTLLLDRTAQRFGFPRHFISDQGSQFKSHLFQDVVKSLRIRPRFGAVGESGSIALIERFWRTIKAAAGFSALPVLVREDLERRLELALAHYAYHRPHQGLHGATPAEIFFNERPAHLDAVNPPRGRRGEPVPSLPFEISFLDPEGRYPVLLKAA